MDGKNLHSESDGQPLIPDIDKAWMSMLSKLDKEMPVTGEIVRPYPNFMKWFWFAIAAIVLLGFLFYARKNDDKAKAEELSSNQRRLGEDKKEYETKENISLGHKLINKRTDNLIIDIGKLKVINKDKMPDMHEDDSVLISKTTGGKRMSDNSNRADKKEVAEMNGDDNKRKDESSGKIFPNRTRDNGKMNSILKRNFHSDSDTDYWQNHMHRSDATFVNGINTSTPVFEKKQRNKRPSLAKYKSKGNNSSVIAGANRENYEDKHRRRSMYIAHDSLLNKVVKVEPVRILHDSSSLKFPREVVKSKHPSTAQLQAGIEENISVPLHESKYYFTGPSGTSNPTRNFIPGLWVQYGNKNYSILAEVGLNYNASFSSQPYFSRDSIFNTGSIRDTLVSNTSKTMVKAFGLSFGLSYVRTIVQHLSVSVGIQTVFYSSGITRETRTYKNTGRVYGDSAYKSVSGDWAQFNHLQINGTVGVVYSIRRIGFGARIIIPVTRSSNTDFKSLLGAEFILRFRLAGK